MLSNQSQIVTSDFGANIDRFDPTYREHLTQINEDSVCNSSKYVSLTPSEMATETFSESSFNIQLEKSYNMKEEDVHDDPEPKLARLSDTAVMDMQGLSENINKKP